MTYIKSKKFNKASKRSQGLALLSMIIAVAVVCLGFLYIFQTNSLISDSYKIREQEKHLRELEVKNQQLEMQISQKQSPSYLQNMVEQLGMVRVDNAIYLGEDKAVAVK